MTQPVSSDCRPTPTIEDYLAVMYVMDRDGEEIVAARLAESLEVSAPTVTVTLKRMERDGWIAGEGRRGVRLTEAGLEAARSVIRRHMLTEWMLARMLHVPLSRIHDEAHAIEHSISDEIEARMRSNLDDPHTCPHGNPLPGYEAAAADWLPLTEALNGERGILRRIHETAEANPELMHFLEANQIFPGVQVQVVENLAVNQTVTLAIGERQVTLGFSIARYLFMEKN